MCFNVSSCSIFALFTTNRISFSYQILLWVWSWPYGWENINNCQGTKYVQRFVNKYASSYFHFFYSFYSCYQYVYFNSSNIRSNTIMKSHSSTFINSTIWLNNNYKDHPSQPISNLNMDIIIMIKIFLIQDYILHYH